MEEVSVRGYRRDDVEAMRIIWNQVVDAGDAFPQIEGLAEDEAADFFSAQSYCGVAEYEGRIVGLYILHPNNIGRCGHIANASFAVDSAVRGQHIGEKLVRDCLEQGGRLGFRVLQFNAVVAGNASALHLYRKLGFTELGTVPGGFRHDDGSYEDIVLFYHEM